MSKRDNENQSNMFVYKWGEKTLSHGFTQVSNLMMRKLKILGIKSHDLPVIILILSVGDGYLAAKTISEQLGISIHTVRNSFKRIKTTKLIGFKLADGNAYTFDTMPLRQKVHELAKSVEGDAQNMDIPLATNVHDPIQKMVTNKEAKNEKDIKIGPGYKSAREEADRIKTRAKNKPA